MSCVVLKFGGTSVANLARLEHAASIVQKERLLGNHVVVVVSAMAGITNQYASYLHQLCPTKITPEHDVVLASGEQVTSGLMALILQNLGQKSRSYLAWQVPILTNLSYTTAKITHIPVDEIQQCFEKNIIPVIAGFQGFSSEGRITTLGRGGSDTTAVALASALNAKRCDIYTDVDGVYTADPRIVPHARRLPIITYAEMFEMAAQGAKVLQARSVELAMKNRVPLRVLSSFVESEGTYIVEDRMASEGSFISGIAHSCDEAKILIKGVPDEVGMAGKIFGPLANAQISVDFIVQSYNIDGRADIAFVIPLSDLERALELLKGLKNSIGFHEILADEDVAKISVIGVGLKSNHETASIVFQTLGSENINIQLISTSEVKISVVVQKQCMAHAIISLHQAFGLEHSKGKAA